MQAAEEAARAIVQEAAEAAQAAQREADSWKEKFQQTADRSIQAEAKVRRLPRLSTSALTLPHAMSLRVRIKCGTKIREHRQPRGKEGEGQSGGLTPLAAAQMAMMKKEMEKMQRALQREIGEGVELGKVLADDGGGWRGRAQQISLLKDKLREAQSASPSTARVGTGPQPFMPPHTYTHKPSDQHPLPSPLIYFSRCMYPLPCMLVNTN